MAIVVPERFIDSMRYSASLYKILTGDLSQAEAVSARDGDDGWTVLEIMCHVGDFENIFFTRARAIVEKDNPDTPPVDHLAMVIENRYAEQDFQTARDAFLTTRSNFLAWIKERSESDWQRTAKHPTHISYTLLDQVVQAATHDINHLEQMMRSLNLARQV